MPWKPRTEEEKAQRREADRNKRLKEEAAKAEKRHKEKLRVRKFREKHKIMEEFDLDESTTEILMSLPEDERMDYIQHLKEQGVYERGLIDEEEKKKKQVLEEEDKKKTQMIEEGKQDKFRLAEETTKAKLKSHKKEGKAVDLHFSLSSKKTSTKKKTSTAAYRDPVTPRQVFAASHGSVSSRNGSQSRHARFKDDAYYASEEEKKEGDNTQYSNNYKGSTSKSRRARFKDDADYASEEENTDDAEEEEMAEENVRAKRSNNNVGQRGRVVSEKSRANYHTSDEESHEFDSEDDAVALGTTVGTSPRRTARKTTASRVQNDSRPTPSRANQGRSRTTRSNARAALESSETEEESTTARSETEERTTARSNRLREQAEKRKRAASIGASHSIKNKAKKTLRK